MNKKVTVSTIQKIKDNNQKFSVLTAYDYSTAKYIDEAGIDIVLIGDSLAMVALGNNTQCRCRRNGNFHEGCFKGCSKSTGSYGYAVYELSHRYCISRKKLW